MNRVFVFSVFFLMIVNFIYTQENIEITDQVNVSHEVYQDTLAYSAEKDSLVLEVAEQLISDVRVEETSPPYLLYIKDIIWALVILTITFSLLFIIVKFNHRFELVLERLSYKDEICISILPKKKINIKPLLSFFLFFYDGLKSILIVYIIVKCVSFLLKIASLHEYCDFEPLFNGIFKAITLSIICYYIYKLVRILGVKMLWKYSTIKPKIVEKMGYKSFSIISEDRLIEIAKFLIKTIYFASIVILIYFYITLFFSFFSFTQTWASVLFGYILTPLSNAIKAIIGYLPNVFAILIIFFILKYALKLIKIFFDAINSELIKIKGFYKDWATPTYMIARFLVIVFGVIVVFPYLPGSNSPFFRGISVFLGILFSFGSSSAIANIIAGVVLTYMRPFREGDFVKIAETMGKVIEKTLLVTRVRTTKNIDITVPNSLVLSSHITNYSSIAEEKSIILHTIVTMGYDISWQRMHNALIKAALLTDKVLSDPKPFVLQTMLDDYYVKYELNVHTHESQKMAYIYSELHKNIQDVFNEEGIELTAPSFMAVRDGNKKNTPDEYLEKDYEKPGFKIDPITSFITRKS